MLDISTRGNTDTQEVLPPSWVNSASMTGTGQLPKFKEDLFKIEGWDLFLIPTAEVPVTNIHRDEVLAEESLPINYAAYTPCFPVRGGFLWERHERVDPPAFSSTKWNSSSSANPRTPTGSWKL